MAEQQQEWTGSAAQDPRRLAGEGVEGMTVWDRHPRGRNHPNLKDPGDFKDWMIVSPNSMPEQFHVETTINDTVTPPNPTPPTNISYWGETPPNSEEYLASVEPVAYSFGEGVEEVQDLSEADEERRAQARVIDAGDPQDPVKFAPALGSNQPEAAGTEDVQTISYDASGETTPVEVPIAVSAGVVGYTEEPNATHPSNPDAPEMTPQEGRDASQEEYDAQWEREDDEANTVERDEDGNEKPRARRVSSKKKGRRK